jgi:hypothetical protein
MSVERRDWQELCEAASKEHDPERLMGLISELMETLDEPQALVKRSPEREGGEQTARTRVG